MSAGMCFFAPLMRDTFTQWPWYGGKWMSLVIFVAAFGSLRSPLCTARDLTSMQLVVLDSKEP